MVHVKHWAQSQALSEYMFTAIIIIGGVILVAPKEESGEQGSTFSLSLQTCIPTFFSRSHKLSGLWCHDRKSIRECASPCIIMDIGRDEESAWLPSWALCYSHS